MRLCRFNDDRLGIVENDVVWDVTLALDVIPPSRWPHPPGDPLLRHLDAVLERIVQVRSDAQVHKLDTVRLRSPVANPTKVIAAPGNYRAHVELDTLDPAIDAGVHRATMIGVDAPTEKLGVFLKANSSLCGPADGVQLKFPDRRTDHEVELVAVIGRMGKAISQADALSYVAGYCLGLDMSIRGAEDRSFRKSLDSYAVLGPWLVTADEIADPGKLEISLSVSGQQRQRSNTAALIVKLPRLIELASAAYTLYPGDVLFTGTPEGVGPVVAGDIMVAQCPEIGEMRVAVRA